MTYVLNCEGKLNGIDPTQIVTLSSEQFIPGTTTFNQLEVTETLEVIQFVCPLFYFVNSIHFHTNHFAIMQTYRSVQTEQYLVVVLINFWRIQRFTILIKFVPLYTSTHLKFKARSMFVA